MMYTFVKDNTFTESLWLYGTKSDLMKWYNDDKAKHFYAYSGFRVVVHHYDNTIPCFLQIKNNFDKGTVTYNFYDLERGMEKAFKYNLFSSFRSSARFEKQDVICLARDVEWYLVMKDSNLVNPMKERVNNDYMFRTLVIKPLLDKAIAVGVESYIARWFD